MINITIVEYSIGTITSYPSNIRVSQINRHQLAFSWSPIYGVYPAMHYSVNATNCGECPSITYSHTIACNIRSLILPQVCSIAIQAVACNDEHGPTSEQLTVALQGSIWFTNSYYDMHLFFLIVLDAPSYSVIPEYSGETKYINKIMVKINSSVSFPISLFML